MPSVRRRTEKKRTGPGGVTRRRYCHFCKEKVDVVDYKDFGALRKFISDRGKIKSPRTTGTCRRHQRQVAVAVKRAREMALLPYVFAAPDAERGGRRRSR